MEGVDEECVVVHINLSTRSSHITCSDDPLTGPVQELDLDSDEEDEPQLPVKLKGRKSKQQERPSKIIPTGSDASSDDEDEDAVDGLAAGRREGGAEEEEIGTGSVPRSSSEATLAAVPEASAPHWRS